MDKIEYIPHSERCWFCGKKKATLLCDFPQGYLTTTLDFKKTLVTCSRQMCENCATKINGDIDICPHCIKKLKEAMQAKISKKKTF